MSYEERGHNRYYYRKVWREGTCVSEYVGGGGLADIAAAIDGIESQRRTMARLELQRFFEDLRRVDRAIDSYRAQVRQLVAAMLHELGFHQHKRQWRLRREGSRMANEVVKNTKDEVDEYIELWRAAEGKSKGPALDRLRDYTDAHPTVFEHLSMLARSTSIDVVNSASKSETTRIMIAGEVRALKRSLGVETATPLERLLIEDVALCWLRTQIFEQLYTQNYEADGGITYAKAEYLEKRLSATRRRYLQSIESLARVRGLLARVGVQINVAQEQIVVNG